MRAGRLNSFNQAGDADAGLADDLRSVAAVFHVKFETNPERPAWVEVGEASAVIWSRHQDSAACWARWEAAARDDFIARDAEPRDGEALLPDVVTKGEAGHGAGGNGSIRVDRECQLAEESYGGSVFQPLERFAAEEVKALGRRCGADWRRYPGARRGLAR